jgi:DNA-binding NarL/FixJ family response regulator
LSDVERVATVVVVDDHKSFADALAMGLSAEEDFRCVGAAYDLASGLALVDAEAPDVVIMDLKFDGDRRDGVAAASHIHARHPTTRVVLLTGQTPPNLVRRAAEACVSALVPKNGSLTDLMKTLRKEPENGLFVHPQLLTTLMTGQRDVDAADVPSLSRRERDVLAMMTLGNDVNATARQLGISVATCRGYVKTLFVKLDAHSQLEAVAIGRRYRLANVQSSG